MPANRPQKNNMLHAEQTVRVDFFVEGGPINGPVMHVFSEQVPVSLFNPTTNRDDLRKYLHTAIEVYTSVFGHHATSPCEICKAPATGFQHSTFPRSGDPRPNSFPPFFPVVKGYVTPICGGLCGSQVLKQLSAKEQFPGLGATKIVSCKTCGKKGGIKKCGGCDSVGYCSAECQKKHWPSHKQDCKRVQSELSVLKNGEKELDDAIQQVRELHGVKQKAKEQEEAIQKLREAPGGKTVVKIYENAMERSKEDEANRFTEHVAKRAKDCRKEQQSEEMIQEMKKATATKQLSNGDEMFQKAADEATDRVKAKEKDAGTKA